MSVVASVPPDTIRIHTAENVSLGYATAGVGSRLVAQVIDNAIAYILFFIALLGGLAVANLASSSQGAAFGVGAAIAFATLVYAAYFFVSELVTGGRTLGKNVMGLRVLRVNGAAPDFAAIAVRNIVRIIDVTGIGLIVMFFHPLSRRLGDLAAGTVVVRDRQTLRLATVSAAPPLIVRTPDAGPSIDGIERLGSAEYNALRVFLSRPGLTPELRHRLAVELGSRMCDRLQLQASAPERMWPAELLLERLYLQLDQRLR